MIKKSHLPNTITALRVLGTLCLLFLKPLTLGFFIVYSLTGLSDLLDGYIARKTNTASKLGAKLDSIADLFFYSVMLIKIFPILKEILPRVIWIAVGAILALRICTYMIAAIKYHCFSALHTKLNKATGCLLFVVPYLLELWFFPVFCWVICIVAGIAAAEEFWGYAFSNPKDAPLQFRKTNK
jgi:CDP-diacylglycerol--glycerol-3-phosphate 3-phosphatidyltransferase